MTYVATAGLCNRIRAHLACSELARVNGARVAPVWIQNAHCGADFGDLFNTGPMPARNSMGGRTKVGSFACKGAALYGSDKCHVLDIDWQYQEIHVLERLLGCQDLIRHLPRFRPEVLAGADRLLARLGADGIVVHIRRGDFVTHTGQALTLSHYTEQIRSLVALHGKLPVHIISDGSRDELCGLIEGFDAVLVSSHSDLGRGQASVINAAHEILFAARSRFFIGTPRSSFSEIIMALRNSAVLDAQWHPAPL
jgi:hypothetical protein